MKAHNSKSGIAMRSTHLSAENMRIFIAIGRSSTLTEAASALELPLFTVSRALKRIEAASKLSLVRRDKSGLDLTAAGRDYLTACLNVLEAHEAACDVLNIHRKEPEGTLKISNPVPFGVHVLAEILPAFQKLYSGLNIDLHLYCSDWDKPPSAAFDVTFKVRSPKDSRHHLKLFPSIRQGLFASPEYLKSRTGPTHPTELDGHRCLGLTRDPSKSGWSLVCGSDRLAINPPHWLIVPDMEIMTRLAINAGGIAVLPLWRAYPEVLAGTLEAVLPDWAASQVQFCALHGGRLRMPSRESAFLDFLAGVLGTADDPRCKGQDPNKYFVLNR